MRSGGSSLSVPRSRGHTIPRVQPRGSPRKRGFPVVPDEGRSASLHPGWCLGRNVVPGCRARAEVVSFGPRLGPPVAHLDWHEWTVRAAAALVADAYHGPGVVEAAVDRDEHTSGIRGGWRAVGAEANERLVSSVLHRSDALPQLAQLLFQPVVRCGRATLSEHGPSPRIAPHLRFSIRHSRTIKARNT